MLLGYPVNTFLEFKPVYNILLDPGVCKQRYYKMTLSDYITPDYPPTYHWYGKKRHDPYDHVLVGAGACAGKGTGPQPCDAYLPCV